MKIYKDKLIMGKPIFVTSRKFKIKPKTIDEITDLHEGKEEYDKFLSSLIIGDDDKGDAYVSLCRTYKNSLIEKMDDDMRCLEVDYERKEYLYETISDAFSFFLDKEVFFMIDENEKCGFYFIEKDKTILINKEDFLDVVDILFAQNRLDNRALEEDTLEKKIQNINDNPKYGSRMKEIMIKDLESDYLIKISSNQSDEEESEESLTFESIISCVCHMKDNGINQLNIGKLTLYELYDHFQRGQSKICFDSNFQLKWISQNVADQDKIETEHWLVNLK